MTKKNTNCCKCMNLFTEDQSIPIIFLAKTREYGIRLRSSRVAINLIDYCPWCGKELPFSLEELWIETLEKEHGLDDPFDEEQEKLIPKEFETDEWWKKRKIREEKDLNIKTKVSSHKKGKNCCDNIDFFLNEGKVAIKYYPISRSYFLGKNLSFLVSERGMHMDLDNYEYARQSIYFCPWCGTKLPPALNNKYFDVLEQEYEIHDFFDEEQVDRIPDEFNSDEWWKKRGL